MLKKLKRAIRGKKKLQRLFTLLHQYSLSGMNIGSGADFDGSGEKWTLDYVRASLSGSSVQPIVFDVGANIGDYTKEVVSVFKEKVTVYAFEPAEHTFRQLQKNCATVAGVSLQQVALGDAVGVIDMYSDGDSSAIASVHKRRLDHYAIAMDAVESVPVTTLDDFCKKNDIQHIDFLKLDVEGNELSVLRGATELLQKKAIRFIQFEFGGANIDSRTFFQDFYYLLHDQYVLYRVLGDGLAEITAYNERYEIFMTTNFLAIKR